MYLSAFGSKLKRFYHFAKFTLKRQIKCEIDPEIDQLGLFSLVNNQLFSQTSRV